MEAPQGKTDQDREQDRSPATTAAPSFSTKETTNYARLCRLLVDVSAQILRETFDKRRPTGNLDAVLSSPPVHAVLRSLRHKRILNPSQWGKLYPALKSAVSSNSFDITLLMVLLRKICGLVPPATGWDTPPPEADTTLEADIVRIKCYINTVHSHASEASVDDPTFSQYWQDIQDAFLRLGGAGYQSAIDDLKKECMEPDLEEHYKELLKQWVMHEVSIKERLGEIGKSEVELKEAAVDPEEKAGDKAMEVPQGKTDRDREQDRSPGNNLQNTEKLKPNDKAGRGETYRNLGIVHQNSSDFHEAIEYHECHLQTAKEGGDKAGQERAYGNLGNDLKCLDDCHNKCYECHPQTTRELGGKARKGRAYGNLGIAYRSLGDYHKAIENHERHLKFAKQVGDKAGEGRALRNLGNAYHSLGDFHKAIEYLMHDLKIAREVGDKAGEGQTYGNLGNVYDSLGDFRKAIEYHEHHLKITREERDKAGEGRALGNLGNAYHSLGDFHKAIEYLMQDLKIAREVGDKAGEGQTYGNLGNAYFSLSDFHKAVEYHERHLQIAREVGDKAGEGGAYGNLGTVHNSLSDFHEAIACHERHLQIAKEVGDKAGEGRAYGNLGNVYENLSDFHKAIEYHERHLLIAKEVGDKAGEGKAYGNLGISYDNLGDYNKAIEYHKHDLEIARKVGDKAGEGGAYGNLGNAYFSLGNLEKAIEYHKRHLQIAIEVGNEAGEGAAYGNLGNAYNSLGEFHKAIKYHKRDQQIAIKVGDRAGEGHACRNLGIAYGNLNDFNKAIKYHERHLQIAKEVGDKAGERRAYGSLGNAFHSSGNFRKAIEYHERHLQIAKEVGDKAGEGESYANEEDEVPYYTGRKDLADIEDATVDTDDSEKTLIKRGKIGGKEDTWYLREAGASIKLCSGAVQQPVPFTCRCLLWNPRTLSPSTASDEILVSSVIEISHDGPPDLDYRKSFEGISFTVSLLHSAPYLEGYEVVIKQLTDQENNEWKELKTENTWHGSETSTVPKWLFPFAQAVCTKSAVSSFAAVWRPKSFTFSRGTAGGPELTCIVPDLPDVSVQIPQSCVPVYQDFCVTIKVQEFPSSELKGEGGLVGPVLYISGSQNISLIAPLTIRIPLTLRKGKQELAELRPGELRILQCEAHDWKDITDKLVEPPRLVDGKVQFKVRHFSRFCPIKLMRSLLQSTSGFTEFVGKLCYRSRPQHARFFTCLCETGVRGHFKLKLFCYPQRLYYDVIRKISECAVLYKDEGCSSKPVCGEEKILVSLSEAIIPQDTDQKNALQFVRFHENKVYYTGGEVCLGNESVPGVKFCDQNQQLLCNIIMVLASQVSIPVTSDFEEGSGISSQSVKHSIVKHPNSESPSYSPVAASRKKIHQSTGIYLVKDSEPSNEELECLSRELAGKWKTLGRRLGFNEAAIDDFDQANKELAEKAYKMLMAWKQKGGCEATYKVLYDSLCHKLVECKRLAEQYCR